MYTVKGNRRHQTGVYLFNDGQKPPRVEESTKPICWNFFTTLEKEKKNQQQTNLSKKVNFILNQIPRDSINAITFTPAFGIVHFWELLSTKRTPNSKCESFNVTNHPFPPTPRINVASSNVQSQGFHT